MQSLVFLTNFFQKLSEKNLWGVGRPPPPLLVKEGLTLSGLAFSVICQTQRGAQRPRSKNQSWHQSIEMKLCLSHYSYNSILDAKFEADSSSSFADMTSQIFPWKKRTSHQIWVLTPEKLRFYVLNRSFWPKIDPPCQFQQFSSRGKFFIFRIFGMCRWEKSSSNPLIDQVS